jgi:four helix bundle protein
MNRENARDYKELLVWQKARVLAKLVYELTRHFPGDEKFGLISQMRRSGISIPCNIAEGQVRHTSREFIRFISHAEGSVAELETQLLLSVDVGMASPQAAAPLLDRTTELRRMLGSLRITLSNRLAHHQGYR